MKRRTGEEEDLNVIFVEPGFPDNQRQFVRALRGIGARVTGVGERPFDWLDDETRGCLVGYEQVASVTDERALYEAVRRVQGASGSTASRPRSRRTSCRRQGARSLHHPRHLGAHGLPLPRQGGDEGGARAGGGALRRLGRRLEPDEAATSRRRWASR